MARRKRKIVVHLEPVTVVMQRLTNEAAEIITTTLTGQLDDLPWLKARPESGGYEHTSLNAANGSINIERSGDEFDIHVYIGDERTHYECIDEVAAYCVLHEFLKAIPGPYTTEVECYY